ncbi:MAG TPA: PQQ-dependent sugar dehydrogenase [Candidatus Limnocylindrales bacterium]
MVEPRRGRVLAAIAVLGLASVVIACSSATPTPSLPGPTLPVSPEPTAATPTAAAGTPGASSAPFDPTVASVSLQAFATVPGGPLAITAPEDGSGRLFVAAQDGRAWVVASDGQTRSTPLLDIRERITTGGERGLLGLAIHPGFPSDPRVYVDYTDRQGNTVVSSFRLDASDPDRLDPSSEVVMFTAGQPFPNHNGGALAFGPDGDLYISLGDGGGGGDPQGNGQRLDTTLGKILRVDVDRPSGGRPYGIPADNPFAGDPLKRQEIWLYGLRNPWRMSFDRLTGDLWIGDVGQGEREEVDVARAGVGGLNFGWNRMEGTRCFEPAEGCDRTGLTLPVVDYGHDQGCVVIGGVVYRGGRYPILRGGYVYADYCSGRTWLLDAAASSPAVAEVGNVGGGVAAFGEDEAGEVYVANLDGTISRVVAAP